MIVYVGFCVSRFKSVEMFQCFIEDYFTVGLLSCLFVCLYALFMFTELKPSE